MNEIQPYWNEEGFLALGEDLGESIAQMIRTELANRYASRELVTHDQHQGLLPPIKPSTTKVVTVKGGKRIVGKRDIYVSASPSPLDYPSQVT